MYAADNVTVTGMAQTLPYVPLMDSFTEYAEDSWTYDGRFGNVIQVNSSNDNLSTVLCL